MILTVDGGAVVVSLILERLPAMVGESEMVRFFVFLCDGKSKRVGVYEAKGEIFYLLFTGL